MKCKLPAINVKLFAKAIHSLAKLGSEIYIEPLEDGLALKTVNSSRSAYASFLFRRPLFQIYEHQVSEENLDESFKCKVAVKTLLQVFKSLSNIEKSVESCDINLNEEDCRLVFQLKCRHGIVKTHQLTFQECESLQAVFAKDLSPNILKCEHKLLNDVVVNFQSTLEEITMCVSPCQVSFKSYIDADDAQATMLKTEMTLNPEEFADFQVGVDTDVTFSLKDLRAVLGFCDVAALPVQFYFETGGKPLVISIEEEDNLKINFVLATICNDELSQKKTYNKPAQVNGLVHNRAQNGLKRKNSKNNQQQKTSNERSITKKKNATADNLNLQNFNVKTSEEQGSPEIPIQHYQLETTAYQQTQPSQNDPTFQGIRKVFFEPSQICEDHSLVVLAPDSDGENT